MIQESELRVAFLGRQTGERFFVFIAKPEPRNDYFVMGQVQINGRLRRFTTANSQRIQDILGSFDPDWREDLGNYLVDERKAAVDSIVDLRQTISHGRYAGVTLAGVKAYYAQVKDVVDHIADLCDPA